MFKKCFYNLSNFTDRRRNYMKGKIYLKQQPLKNTFAVKKYGKGLLVQIKEEEVYKIIANKEFTKEDSPFQRVEPHMNLNTQLGTVYSRNWQN